VNLTVSTGIRVDHPTSFGRTFTREAVQRAVSDPIFIDAIKRGMMLGGIINRGHEHLAMLHEATHIVIGMRIDGDMLVADIQLLDTPKGLEVQRAITHGAKLVAKPIISLPLDQDTGKGVTIDSEFRIIRVQIETQ